MNISRDKELEYINSVLKRYFADTHNEYNAVYYPLKRNYQWLNKKTGKPIDDEKLREQLDDNLNGLMYFLHDLLFYIAGGYITKEDTIKLVSGDSGQ